MKYAYPVRLEPDEDGVYVASARDVPEALTEGATVVEAIQEMSAALGAALAGYIEQGRPVPVPSLPKPREHIVPVAPLVAAKLALRSAMRAQGVSNVGLAERLGVSEGAVRRLVNPDHASRIDGVIDALAALGQCLIIEDQIQEPPDGRHSGSQRVVKR
ncbi:MAG: type II toxin-antitoxin system HicB family antitoxin [Pseudomonadales bacterium]|jgi:antitoxin HicB|nr:type II toxin-antitoxin system HicB family antitoxin [Pseudomonadales bacterium]